MAKAKRGAAPTSPIVGMWEKYGTWVTGGLTVILALILVGVILRRREEVLRHRSSRVRLP